MRKVALLFVSSWLVAACVAQATDSTWAPPASRNWVREEITLLAGHAQGRFGHVEAGLGHSLYGVVLHPVGINYYVGAEVRPDRPSLVGWKIGGFLTFGGAMGLELIRYQEGTKGSTMLRPGIGIGIWKAKATYAYNINLSPERLDGTSTHMVSIAYALRLVTLTKRDDRARNGP